MKNQALNNILTEEGETKDQDTLKQEKKHQNYLLKERERE